MADKLPIIEIFGPTIQGEGYLLGYPTHFLRTGGCGYRCTWCDTMFAVDPKLVKQNRTMMTIEDIANKIKQLPHAPWLTLTGGDPCLHDRLGPIIPWCHANDMRVCVETQGEMWPEWLKDVDVVTFSPKGPTSGENTDITKFRDNLVKFQQSGARCICIVKIVVFDRDDLNYALRAYNELTPAFRKPLYDRFYFQVGSPLTEQYPAYHDDLDPSVISAWKRHMIMVNYEQLVEDVLEYVDDMNHLVSITPQTHTLLWPSVERGR